MYYVVLIIRVAPPLSGKCKWTAHLTLSITNYSAMPLQKYTSQLVKKNTNFDHRYERGGKLVRFLYRPLFFGLHSV